MAWTWLLLAIGLLAQATWQASNTPLNRQPFTEIGSICDTENSRVYRAIDLNNAMVVIKCIKCAKQKNINLVNGEVEALEKLVNSKFSVLLLKTFDDAEGLRHLVFKYEPAVTLKQLIFESDDESVKILSANAAFYVANLVAGLEEIHKLNVIHNDIKLENVLFCEDGYLKFIDFGLSDLTGSMPTRLNSNLKGTPLNMAPELFQGELNSYASDWYSLGVLLYGLFTRTYLFDLNNLNLIGFVNRLESHIVEYPACLSAELVELLKGLLEKSPVKRWAYPDSMSNIKALGLFAAINWDGMMSKTIVPPLLFYVDEHSNLCLDKRR